MNLFKKQNRIKTALVVFSIMTFGAATAQQTSGDATKEADIVPGTTALGGAIRVIDNKGTIKYLQSKNGITMLSNTTNDVTTTTWQLGGTLTDNTYIDVDGNAFVLNGIELVDSATEDPSTDATTESDHGTGTGYTLLVRDEATGATKKLLATDLLQSGHQMFTTTALQVSTPDYTYTLSGTPALAEFSKVWVYRNGAKLIAGLDYTVAGAVVTLVPNTTVPNDWTIYENDIIEVQYVK